MSERSRISQPRSITSIPATRCSGSLKHAASPALRWYAPVLHRGPSCSGSATVERRGVPTRDHNVREDNQKSTSSKAGGIALSAQVPGNSPPFLLNEGFSRMRLKPLKRVFCAVAPRSRYPVRRTGYRGAGLARWLYSNVRRRSSSSLGSLEKSSAQSFPTAIPLCTAGRADSSSNQRLKYLNSLMSWPWASQWTVQG